MYSKWWNVLCYACSNNNYYMHISCKIRGIEIQFSSYMRIGVMEYAQGSYNHEEEIIGLNVGMGSVEKDSNGRRDRKDHVTMRSLQKKV